jgi:hypothetical protein
MVGGKVLSRVVGVGLVKIIEAGGPPNSGYVAPLYQ